jgi:hypothetical protein
LIDTSCGGLIHYPDEAALEDDQVKLRQRRHDL